MKPDIQKLIEVLLRMIAEKVSFMNIILYLNGWLLLDVYFSYETCCYYILKDLLDWASIGFIRLK